MLISTLKSGFKYLIVALFLLTLSIRSVAATTWRGVLRDHAGQVVSHATVNLHALTGAFKYSAETSPSGEFVFAAVQPGSYALTVTVAGKTWKAANPRAVADGTTPLTADLDLSEQDKDLIVLIREQSAAAQGSGGETLSSAKVSNLPLNERDFSKLLLLAAGTMTDTNGAANFTQQFAVNGQRGVASVFAMDGADTSDPEQGGATFSNFNVDAIQEVQSSSGVMPAEIGHGASGFTNVITKEGNEQVHGSAFEFVRNAAFDARNFFDHQSAVDPRRIPPFERNEFGATNGGPVVLPGIYNGRGKTFYFVEYQGFRQLLGTTQVLAVPTAAERQGIDTTSFPGDTLIVPASPLITPLLDRYPLPNNPQGPYGARTYSVSSKVITNTDQFSVRVDHRLSSQATLFTRFSLNQVNGPTTNPDQTAVDPNFGVNFFDHQRNAAIRYSRTVSPHFSFTTAFSYIRSTPIFPASDHTDPALAFGDGSFEGFNSADGSILGSYGNLFQFRHDMINSHAAHTLKWGVEIRGNVDSTVYGTNPDGVYTFGGGTAYSPVFIPSVSGLHDILPGAPLPDSLTGLLTATPYSYTVSVAASFTPAGDKFDEAAVRREAYNFYFQDSWKATSHLSVNYGLRYEVNSRIKEAQDRTSVAQAIGPDGRPTSFLTPGATEAYLYNPQPIYPMDWNGWGPRVSVDYGLGQHTMLHAGGAITTILPNLWQDNAVTGGFPFVFQPLVTAETGIPVAFHNTVVPVTLPAFYTTQGQPLVPAGGISKIPANTPIDWQRFQNDLNALTPGGEVQLIATGAMARNFRNGYIGTYTTGLDHDFGAVKLNLSYVGTAGVHLASIFSPNGYAGADPAFARYTEFDAAGHATGGFGSEGIMTTGAHSSYNALQSSLTKNSARLGLSFQASYTFSKSIDDTSYAMGTTPANAGVINQTLPQNPLDSAADRGPSTFDVTHAFSLNLIQSLPFDRVNFLRRLGEKLTKGWLLLNITTITSGLPFSVYSGIQQTGAGAGGADRPDLAAPPDFSTSRSVREDYFGRGAENGSFFDIPTNVSGGTGPNHGLFGTLGRDTFRGPGFRDYDFALIKDTSVGHRGANELGILEFRAEFFNIFNIVDFGLPANTLLGSGFGIINHTAGPSRQIQFSLKLIY
ncbi:MAG: carboxypeptidase-like regulatory domain-containing protein [Candidatus Acidiferrales bacterium]